jgi:hypothetical protein
LSFLAFLHEPLIEFGGLGIKFLQALDIRMASSIRCCAIKAWQSIRTNGASFS